MTDTGEGGFSLVELLVVVIILGILAAIGIPRFLSQRERANDATAVADLRNLVAVETSLEAVSGLTDDPAVLAAEDWAVTDPAVVVCAELAGGGQDLTLTAWHRRGSLVYSYTRSSPTINSADVPLPADCDEASGGAATQVS